MKKNFHPNYNPVVFKDITCDYMFLSRSTLTSNEKVKWTDGIEYPLIKIEISSASHPFFTGKQTLLDTSGRIEKFYKKFKTK